MTNGDQELIFLDSGSLVEKLFVEELFVEELFVEKLFVEKLFVEKLLCSWCILKDGITCQPGMTYVQYHLTNSRVLHHYPIWSSG